MDKPPDHLENYINLFVGMGFLIPGLAGLVKRECHNYLGMTNIGMLVHLSAGVILTTLGLVDLNGLALGGIFLSAHRGGVRHLGDHGRLRWTLLQT